MKHIRESLVGTTAPELAHGEWLNTAPWSIAELVADDSAVLLAFWTSSCASCQRSVPHLNRWWNEFQASGLTILGIHAPEFAFEKSADTVRRAIRDLGITWPVVHDPDHSLWRQFGNRYWPRLLLVDHRGIITHDHIGEGGEQETEGAILALLSLTTPSRSNRPHTHKLGTICYPTSPDTYLGAARGTRKNAQRIVPGSFVDFVDPVHAEQPGVALRGRWKVAEEYVANDPTDPGATLSLVFSGVSVHLVAGSDWPEPVELEVQLNGQPVPTQLRGSDLVVRNDRTLLRLAQPRLHRLIRAQRAIGHGILDLVPSAGSLQAYVFTFGGCPDDSVDFSLSV